MENNLIKPVGRMNNHHIIPISTWGENTKENIVNIIDRDHKLIHDVLDIPIRFYSEKVRKIKERTNHHIISKPDDIQMRWDLQKEYFSRLHQLPRPIQKTHLESITKNLEYRHNQYQRIAKDTMIDMILWNSISDKFYNTHESYIQVKKEISKEISKVLYLNNL